MPRPEPKSLTSGTWFGVVMVLTTLAGWSSVPLFLKHFSHSIDPWTSNGWRYGFAAVLWLPVVLWGLYRRQLPPGIWRAAIVPGLVNSIGQVCFTYAHYKIDPGLLTFGLRTQIVFVALGAYLLFPSERRVVRSRLYQLGLLMVLAGSVGTVFLGKTPPAGAEALGVTLAIASGLCFAAYALAVRKYMHGTHPVVAFSIISQYTAGAMVVLMLFLGHRLGADALLLAGDQFTWLLVSAVIGIALGHVFYYISIARLGVAVSSGVIQLQPFVVSILSYFLFRELLTIRQWISGCVAVLGAIIMLWLQRRLSRADRATARSAERFAATDARTIPSPPVVDPAIDHATPGTLSADLAPAPAAPVCPSRP